MRGWCEAQSLVITDKGIQKKAPRHREAAGGVVMRGTLRAPVVKKDFDYFIRKFGLTPILDKRIKRGRVVRRGAERRLVITTESDIVKWHELGHLVAEEITKKEIGSLTAGALSKGEYAEGKKSKFYESLMAFKITGNELGILLEFIEKRDIMDEMRRLKEDIVKLKGSTPPFDKIPEQERLGLLKHYKRMLRQFQDYITGRKKPDEVFASFFAMYNLDRKAATSRLSRLIEEWGHVIDRYMEEA